MTHQKLVNYLTNKVSPKTLDVMKTLDRAEFVPQKIKTDEKIYLDSSHTIGHGVTISQPSLVGKMIDYLELDSINNVLELGTGSGYNAAIMGKLLPFGSVTTVERVPSLGKHAKKVLKKDKNVKVITGDATKISYSHKFDRIIATAEIMNRSQMKRFVQENAATFCIAIFPYKSKLRKLVKCGSNFEYTTLFRVRFVPVIED